MSAGKQEQGWAGTGLALLLGGLGGGLFALLNLPLPWMLGSMTACGLFALSRGQAGRTRLHVPKPLRSVMLVLLAVMLGSSFSPALWHQMGQWGLSLGGLLLALCLSVALCMTYFRRRGGLDPVTAYFASAPGGISEMVATGTAMGGEERTIALLHSLRIILIVFSVPFAFRLLSGIPAPSVLHSMGRLGDLAPADGAVLLGLGLLGVLLGRVARFPAAVLTGPLLLSALAHGSGWTASRVPGELVILAQWVTGAGLGARFAGTGWGDVLSVVRLSLGSTALLVLTGGGIAALLSWGTGQPFALLLLAFVPGGIAEMCLIALSLGQDVAFVSTHHVLRVVLVIVAAPLLFTLYRRFRPGG